MGKTKPWSEAEDRAMREFYPRHGRAWTGWREVLPNRTMRAIEARAARLGIIKARTKAVVPYEPIIKAYMAQGMAPSEIDAAMRWRPGNARALICDMWLNDKLR